MSESLSLADANAFAKQDQLSHTLTISKALGSYELSWRPNIPGSS